MTDNVSRPLGRIVEGRVPEVCPICGARMAVMFAVNLVKHLRAQHPLKLGRARPADGRKGVVWREFAETGYVPSGVKMYVIWLDFAYGVESIYPLDWIIEWKKDGRTVPVNEGETK